MKSCVACAEEIKSEAKICHYCQSPQNKFVKYLGRNPYGIPLFLFLGFYLTVTMYPGLFTKYIFDAKKLEKYGMSIGEFSLEINSDEMDAGSKYAVVKCSGQIKNQSTKNWVKPEVNTRFYDEDGNLLDNQAMVLSTVYIPAGQKALLTSVISERNTLMNLEKRFKSCDMTLISAHEDSLFTPVLY